jgi:hypothetical protein
MKKDQIIDDSITQIRYPIPQQQSRSYDLEVIWELYEIDLVNTKYRYIPQFNQPNVQHYQWWFGSGAAQCKELSCTATS